MELWILLCGITFVAAIIRGAVGMGFALMVIPFYLIADPDMVPSTIVMIGLLLSTLVVLRDRRSLDTKGLKYSLLGRLVGSILAAVFIGYLSGTIFDMVIAVMILTAIVLSLLPYQLALTPGNLLLAGFGSGVMGTISSLDGPPIALLYQHQKGEVIRATLAGYFIVGAVFSLVALGFAGRVTLHSLHSFLILAPPAIIGFLLSKYLVGILKESFVRYAILLISGISALLILGKAFF